MANSVDIVPALGQGVSFLQEGPGASPGYGAIDRRRMLVAAGAREGIVHANAYKVSAAGTGMTVLVDADAGMVNIQPDNIAFQGIYTIAPHSANVTLDIAAAHATLPRNDLVILDVLDDDSDNGGLNKARVRVVTGTPTAGAVLTDAFGAHGTPTLFANQFPLALVNVPATDTVITSSQVDDRRLRTAGLTTIATSEPRTNTAYGLLATPDQVRNIVVPTDGLLRIAFTALWKESVSTAASAAIFIGANQLSQPNTGGIPTAQATFIGDWTATGAVNRWTTLMAGIDGLVSSAHGSVDTLSAVTTGQLIGGMGVFGDGASRIFGGEAVVYLAAGTYDVSVQFRASSGTVTVKERKLWAWTQPFPG